MLTEGGPKLNFNWLTPALLIIAVTVCVTLKCLVPLSMERFIVLLLNVAGTVLLASAFEPHIPKMGDGGWWDSIKWAVKGFPKYGSPPAFDVLRFYIGLFLLLIGIVLSTTLS
jgi:hypothetical protein